MSKDTYIHPSATVDYYMLQGAGFTVERNAHVGSCMTIGRGTIIGEDAKIQGSSYIGENVKIGPSTSIGYDTLIMTDARICPDGVKSGSTNARELGIGVTIGVGVLLHNEVTLGNGAMIPTQRTIMSLGNFGVKNRVVTVYGSDDGPRYSVGCQAGIDIISFKSRVGNNSDTSRQSADTYGPFLGIFSDVGRVLQGEYDKERALVEELRAIRQEVGLNIVT